MDNFKTMTTYKQGLKEKILDKAMHAFAAQGIKAVRMDDIAQMMGISKRTLYELYENKEVLLYEGVKTYRIIKEQEMKALVDSSQNVMDIILRAHKKKVEELKKVNANFYSDIAKYPTVKQQLEENQKYHHQRTLAFFKRGVAEGYFRGEVDYMLTIRIFDAIGNYIMAQELYRQYSLEHILNNLFFVTLRGFCTDKGVAALDAFLKEQPLSSSSR